MTLDEAGGYMFLAGGGALGAACWFELVHWGWAFLAVPMFAYGVYLLRSRRWLADDGVGLSDAVDVISDVSDLLD